MSPRRRKTTLDPSGWPTHPDGSRKRYGEMTRTERLAQVKASCERLGLNTAPVIVEDTESMIAPALLDE